MMCCKTLHRRNGMPAKVLSRLLWHPAYRAGFPIRFRVASNIAYPVVRFNGCWLDVRLPMEQGRYIRLLARLVKQWRNGQRKKPRDSPTENTSLRQRRQATC
jgi:hypothetical protein